MYQAQHTAGQLVHLRFSRWLLLFCVPYCNTRLALYSEYYGYAFRTHYMEIDNAVALFLLKELKILGPCNIYHPEYAGSINTIGFRLEK